MSYRKRVFDQKDNQEQKRQKISVTINSNEAISGAKARILNNQDKLSNPSTQYSKDTADDELPQQRIQKAKERLKKKEREQKSDDNEGKGGLNVEIHPLLRSITTTSSLPRSRNPLKQNVRDWFDPAAINPYLNQSDMAALSKRQHKPKALHFNPHGKYISQANDMREKLKRKEIERRKYEETKSKGLTADEDLGEHLFKPEYPPPIGWWDQPYVQDRNYDNISDESHLIFDNEIAPISIYIQHPVLIPPPWEKNLPEPKPMYLTKKEMKRLRCNERQEKHRDKRDRIKLGLDPPPPPKIKLSNLMNVLTNEAIKDPTAVEIKVREEIEERYQKHMQANEERKPTKEQRHNKIQQQHEKDLQKGYFTTVYKVGKLSNLQNFFKIDINAKQLNLVGICLLNPKFNLIIVEGGSKGISFYKKLLTRRINWTMNVIPKNEKDNEHGNVEDALEDLSRNKCSIVWEGQLKELNFKKWSIMKTQNDDEAFDVLNRFGIENYWREARVLDD